METREVVLLSVVFVIGLGFLFYYVKFVQTTPQFHVYDITPNMLGEKVRVCGVVNNLYVNKGNLFFYLSEGNESIKVVAFRNSYRDGEVYRGDIVCVKGEVRMYKSQTEIISHEISHEVVK